MIEEKEGEGGKTGLQTIMRVVPPMKKKGKKNLRFGQAGRAPRAQ